MAIRRYNGPGTNQDINFPTGTTAAGGVSLTTGTGALTGNDNRFITLSGTTNAVLNNGDFIGGDGESNRFLLADILVTAPWLQFNETTIAIGWPELVPGHANLTNTQGPSFPTAGTDSDWAAPADWLLDDNGLVVPARRTKIILNGSGAGAEGPADQFTYGTSGTVVFIGVDFHINTIGNSNFHIGGATSAGGPANNQYPAQGNNITTVFYNCRIYYNYDPAASARDGNSFRFRSFSSNTHIHGLQVVSNQQDTGFLEFFEGPGSLNGFGVELPNIVSGGGINTFATTSGRATGSRSVAFPYLPTTTGGYSGEFDGLNVKNVFFYTEGNQGTDTVDNRSDLILVNPVTNVLMSPDGVGNNVRAANGELAVSRNLNTTLTLEGATAFPDVEIIRRPSNTGFLVNETGTIGFTQIGDAFLSQAQNIETDPKQPFVSSNTETYTGDGTTTAFATNGTTVGTVTLVTVNGVTQVDPTDYTYNAAARMVNFVTAPADGATIFIRFNVTIDVSEIARIQYGIDGNAIEVGANGVFNPNLLHYFERRPNIQDTSVGTNGPKVLLMNRYRIPVYSYGYETQFIGGSEDYYHGGQAVATDILDGANDTYFGLRRSNERREYSPNGETMPPIALRVDSNVTERQELITSARFRVRNWQDLYDSIHLQGLIRTDNDRLNRGNARGEITNGVFDFGSAGLTFRTADRTGTPNPAVGGVGAITGVGAGIEIFLGPTQTATNAPVWDDTVRPAGITDARVATTTGNIRFNDHVVCSVTTTGNITFDATPRNGRTAANAFIPEGITVGGTMAIPALTGDNVYFIAGDASSLNINRSTGTDDVRILLGASAADIPDANLGTGVVTLREVSIPADTAGKYVIWSVTRNQILLYNTTTETAGNNFVTFSTDIFNTGEQVRIFFKGNDVTTGTSPTYYDITRTATFDGRTASTYPAAISGRILSPLLAPGAGTAYPIDNNNTTLVSVSVVDKTASTAYNANLTSTDDALNPNVVNAVVDYTTFDGRLNFTIVFDAIPAAGTPEINYTDATYNGQSIQAGDALILPANTEITVNGTTQTFTLLNDVEITDPDGSFQADSYTRANPAVVGAGVTGTARLVDAAYPAFSGATGLNREQTRFLFSQIQDDPSYLITYARRIANTDPEADNAVIAITFDSRNIELDGRAITLDLTTGLGQLTLDSVARSPNTGADADYFAERTLQASTFSAQRSAAGATQLEVIQAATQAVNNTVPTVVTETVDGRVPVLVRPIVDEELDRGIITRIGRPTE